MGDVGLRSRESTPNPPSLFHPLKKKPWVRNFVFCLVHYIECWVLVAMYVYWVPNVYSTLSNSNAEI